jgi:hypothetical protein
MTVLDLTSDDSRQVFHRLTTLYPPPLYVKQAAHTSLEPPETLPTTAFADVVNKQYPCHTKAATYISWMYFLEARPELPEKAAGLIESRLTNYAERWGIAGDVALHKEKRATAHRDNLDVLPDSSFAIVWVSAAGDKERRLPLRNPGEAKVAAAWFAEHRDSFKWDDRQVIANKILDKAAALGAGLGEDLDDLLEKQAGRGVFVPSRVATMIQNRVRAVDRLPEAVRERMLKMAEDLVSNPILAIDPTTSANLARTIDVFDRNYHLVGKYSALLPRPEDVIF